MNIKRIVFSYIEREILGKSSKKEVIIIYGPRQVGKTTLSKQILKKYPEKSEYFNCDFLDTRELFSEKNIHELGAVLKNLELLVLDEAQRIENIGLILKIIVDNYPHVQVIATGSSSFDLSNKIQEPLTGRKKVFYLFPFAYEELYKNSSILEKQRMMSWHMRFGSYPETVLRSENDASEKLKELTGSYLFKDVFTFQQLKKPELLMKLLQLLAFQIGSEVSFHELAQQLGVDQNVIQRYIHLLEEAFVIFRLSAFKRNLRNEISKSRKIYFWDLGIRNTLIQNINSLDMRDDVGALFENFCILERMKHLHNNQISVNSYFWRTYTQKEIDYIEESGGKISAFEFKWKSKGKTKIPKEFLDTYNNSSFSVLDKKNIFSFIMKKE